MLLKCLAAGLIAMAATHARAASGLPAVIENVAGLRARIEIARDRGGVPHIRAGNEPDAIFGLGFVHAQDRLWQLEYLRRVGAGRLAEVIGPNALKADMLFRTLGVRESAEATWARYHPKHRRFILAYAAGLNAATDHQRRNGLPPEFVLLNFEPERWRAEDVMAIAKVLAWAVDTNWDQEVLRAQLEQKVGVNRTAELMPAYTSDGPVIVPGAGQALAFRRKLPTTPHLADDVLTQLAAFHREVAQAAGFGGQGIGSNNQVLSGGRTTTGKPMLAADPHLPAQIPAMFYRAHVTGGALDAIGTTAVGMPGILMGHNGRLAWGWTNANVDVQDLYIERLREDGQVEYESTLERLRIRSDVIKVKGGDDVLLRVRSTRHGPLISDLVQPSGPALALRWAALDADDDIGMAANLEGNKAATFAQFIHAFRRFKAHPQNMVYADTQGNIAYHLIGAIPRRAAGDGTRPVPGWTSAFEWKGYIPLHDLPNSRNPQAGYLATSNNKIAPDSYRWPLSSSYAAPYRATRVQELLQGAGRFSVADLEAVQADVVAVHARELVPLLQSIAPANNMESRALELLRRWDYRVTPESAAAAVFEAWYIQLAETMFADELGDALWRSWSDQMHMVSIATSSAVRTESAWCDDVTTPTRENCAATISRAFSQSLRRMAAAQGTDEVGAWQWGKAHRIVFFHQPFDADPLLAPRFNRTASSGGDKHTVNVASNPRWREYDQRHLAVYRQIIDLSDFSNSRWMAAPGQSGVESDPHYDDLIDPWRRVESRPMLYAPEAIAADATARVELRP
ncbi:MAG TPA: penicillin acylase family protein [Bryobacteraceae bacterium]|nr:penicillin acylase family protein [Bryobacteraceae bacterium]